MANNKSSTTTNTRIMCKFKIRGGGILAVPIDRIDYIEIDDVLLKSKIHILGKAAPVITSEKPEYILKEIEYSLKHD